MQAKQPEQHKLDWACLLTVLPHWIVQAKQAELEEVQQRCRAAEAIAAKLTARQEQADAQVAEQLQVSSAYQ